MEIKSIRASPPESLQTPTPVNTSVYYDTIQYRMDWGGDKNGPTLDVFKKLFSADSV